MAASYIGIGRLYYIAHQITNLKEVDAQLLGECYQLLIECCIEFLIASQEIIGEQAECKFEYFSELMFISWRLDDKFDSNRKFDKLDAHWKVFLKYSVTE